jgi:NADH dehydrogenase (ubiquinone) Fe-S protein 4
MASLRTSAAARLLRGVSHSRAILPASRRFESSVPSTQKEEASVTTPRHNAPDYGVHIDKATSYDLSWIVFMGEPRMLTRNP